MTPNLLLVPSARKSGKLYSVLPIDGSGDLTFTRASTAIETNGSDLLSSVATGVPRLDYTDSTCPKLLLEPARTNLLTYSEQFDNASWSKAASGAGSAPVVTANVGVAPDGTTTADRIQFNTGGSTSSDRSILRQLVTLSATNHHLTFYVKSNTGAGNQSLAFSFNSATSSTFAINENTWTRVDYQGIGTGAASFYGIEAQGSTTTQSADVLIWGAQLEAGSYPTSYIPTTSATATRVVETASLTDLKTKGLIGASEGSIGASMNVPLLARDAAQNLLTFGASGSIFQFYIPSSSASRASLYVDGGSGASLKYTFNTDLNKWIFAWDASGWYFSVNGATVVSGTEVLTFTNSNLNLLGTARKWELNQLYSYTTKLTEVEANNLTK